MEKFSDFKDRKYYKNLEDLAYVLATQQQEYSHIMRESMKKSKVKEGILNLTKVNSIDKTNDLVGLVKNKIGRTYTQKAKLKSNKLSVEQLLGKLSRDINIYFPIVEHRKNVLDNGENYWVAFNPPDHDKNEYFIRAFNQFGEDSLISSKIGIEENLLIIAYSENQESYSPALTRIDPIDDDCIHIESLVVMPCLPDNPNPDPVETAEGINIARIKTAGIHDGLFDGDLELRIEIKQSFAEFNATASLGILDLSSLLNLEVNPYFLFNQTISHDAGHWYWYWYEFRFRNSNKWTYINYKRKWVDRQTYIDFGGIFGDIGLTVYNNIFRLKIVEDDVLKDDVYHNEHYNFLTYPYGNERKLNTVDGDIYIVIEKDFYPITSY